MTMQKFALIVGITLPGVLIFLNFGILPAIAYVCLVFVFKNKIRALMNE